MGKVEWTKEQRQAIYENGSNILVAAAAGSGKTAVLVERIINKILNDNIDIDKLLVVTFTNAAASEMRQRILDAIYKKLEEEPENEKLQRQITLLNKANICTIDSFCLDVVKSHFYELENISPNFRIADNAEIELLKQDILEELFEEKYELEDNDFIKLINTYTSYRDDTPLKELILKIYTYTQSSPFPEEWIKEHIEMFNLRNDIQRDFSNTVWGKILLEDVKEELIDNISALQDVQTDLLRDKQLEKFSKTIEHDIDMLKVLLSNNNSWDNTYKIWNEICFNTWPKVKIESEIKDEAKQVRDNVKKKLNQKLNKILVSNSIQANKDIVNMYETLILLQNIILEFGQVFLKRKREKNIVDFSDIEHLALQILEKKHIANKYKEKFIEIAIDEYQDSNLVQEYIMSSISKGDNMFMVGDVKQSIYKFRQAMPELFLDKYNKYKNKDDRMQQQGLKIQLFKNFRSRKNILDFTNFVFENIMSSELGDVNYNKDEFLNLGAEDYKNINQDLKTEINIINVNEQYIDENEDVQEFEMIEDIELEAKFVANKIKEMINNRYKIYDRKKAMFRDVKYKDIVILLRSTKDKANIFEQEILNLQMPVFSDGSQEYLDSIEIQTIMSLLKIIDNPIQDIPLVAVLRSNIGGFTDNDLVQIRLSDKYSNFYDCLLKAKTKVEETLRNKIDVFIQKLDKWRKQQEYLSLDELIWEIYNDTGYYNYVGLMTNGILRQANLKILFQRAKQYEKASFKGLYNFINFIEKLKLNSGDLGSAKIIGENDDVIRIMSIHKSKGLEFPIVFLSNTGKQFNMQDVKMDPILLHQTLGIGMKYIDYEKQVQYDTLARAALKSKIITENLSEEMRVFYVALTRAKEKLIITGVTKNYEKDVDNIEKNIKIYQKDSSKINKILLKKCKRYLDWILLVSMYNKKIDLYELNIFNKSDIVKELNDIKSNKECITVEKIMDIEKIEKQEVEKIRDVIEYEYKYINDTIIPTKTSVSKIKENEYLNNYNVEIDSKIKKQEYNKSIIELKRPKFINIEEKITSSRKGTVFHLCLQKLNEKMEYDINNIEKLIDELKFKGIITDEEAKSININKIFKFTKSNIWKELKQAKEIYREKPFYINIPNKEVFNYKSKGKILVQGIIDLYYINKNDELVLVDYKTDYVQEKNQLIERYHLQLNLYKHALEKALRKKVDKVYIYSTHLGIEIEVET